MTKIEELREKANRLPLLPGVYIMLDASGEVIYVGKAKALKNRVTSYFRGDHLPKVAAMVSHVNDFNVIIAETEFEALVLENSLIKRHKPHYNILLKDDKGYPFLRLDRREPYPRFTLSNRANPDGAKYFGPYGGRGQTMSIIDTLCKTLGLPTCRRVFPRDIGKDRPCLNYHMNQCEGWCQTSVSAIAYRQRMEQARQLLKGNYRNVAEEIKASMLSAADNLEFELAASLRDRLNAVENLGQKQLVTAGTLADTDVVGYGETEAKACFAVLHFSGGNLLDKDYEVFSRPDDKLEAVSSLLKQFYLSRGIAPKRVLLPFEIDDGELFAELLEQQYGRRPKLHVPQRGDNLRLVELACKNAFEEAERVTGREERVSATLTLLGKMLAIPAPKRMESFDISNISGTDIVASMVVFQEGKPKKSDYKRFKVEGLTEQDDYASMRQVVTRRFVHYKAGDKGFDEAPDLLLIDGGVTHAKVAVAALQELNLSFPVFGMVKDDRHRTRALVTPEGEEIRIDNNQAIFSLIGQIQEETHRFAITYHRQLRSKRLRYSELDGIPGIGAKRKQELLRQFKSLSAISQATLPELERLLPKDAAAAVYHHFREKGEE